MKILSKCALGAISVLCLASCGENKVARKGFEIFKNDVEAKLIGASGGRGSITWNSCSYIYFNDNDYPILVGSCWYCITSTIYANGESAYCTDYITYTDGQGTYSDIEAEDYQNAVSVYSAGKIKGEKGTLKVK